MRNIMSFLAGGLFGAGLLVSGMTDTQKVIGWLDFFGNWDPTLAFVMGGAIVPMIFAWRIAATRDGPVVGGGFPDVPSHGLSKDLIVGAVLFGMGWGLAGLCPGPAMASLSWGGTGGVVFLAAMSAGMWVAPPLRNRLVPTT